MSKSDPVTCPDCGWQGLPVRSRLGASATRGRLPAVARCPECCAAIVTLPPVTLCQLERATGTPAVTYRRNTLEAATFTRLEGQISPLHELTLAQDVHGMFVVRHPTSGSFRGATLLDAVQALLGDAL